MIFRSLFVIAAVAAIAGGATFAYFSDTATLSNSTFSAGTLDIQIDKDPSSTNQVWSNGFNAPANYLSKLFPGFTDKQVIDIINVGSVNGNATIKLDVVDGTWSALGDNLKFTVYYDATNSGTFGNAIATGLLSAWNHNTYNLGALPAGQIASVKIVWEVPASAGNDIQGKSVTLNTTFGLEQVR